MSRQQSGEWPHEPLLIDKFSARMGAHVPVCWLFMALQVSLPGFRSWRPQGSCPLSPIAWQGSGCDIPFPTLSSSLVASRQRQHGRGLFMSQERPQMRVPGKKWRHDAKTDPAGNAFRVGCVFAKSLSVHSHAHYVTQSAKLLR